MKKIQDVVHGDFPDRFTLFVPLPGTAAERLDTYKSQFIGQLRLAYMVGPSSWTDASDYSQAEVLELYEWLHDKMLDDLDYKCAVVARIENSHPFVRLCWDLEIPMTIFKCDIIDGELVLENVPTAEFATEVAAVMGNKVRRMEEELIEFARTQVSGLVKTLSTLVAKKMAEKGVDSIELTYFVRHNSEDWTAALCKNGISLTYADPYYYGFDDLTWDAVPHHLLAEILKDPSVTELFNI